jgi:dynein light chain roadblock-type
MSDVEETLDRIKKFKGVVGYIIADKTGAILRKHPSMNQELAEKYSPLMKDLTVKARGVVRDVDPKVRSRSSHLLISPYLYAL